MTQSNLASEEVVHAFIAHAQRLLTEEYPGKIDRCLEKLSDEQVWWRPNEQSNSVGNLLLHLAGNVRQWIICGLGGATDLRQRQAEFDESSVIPKAELQGRLKTTMAEVDKVLASFDSERILEPRVIQGMDVTALDAIFHITEHFSMHTGQIILLTKLLTGKDLHFYDFEGDAPLRRWLSDVPHES